MTQRDCNDDKEWNINRQVTSDSTNKINIQYKWKKINKNQGGGAC